jgi:hypothetical protein
LASLLKYVFLYGLRLPTTSPSLSPIADMGALRVSFSPPFFFPRAT